MEKGVAAKLRQIAIRLKLCAGADGGVSFGRAFDRLAVAESQLRFDL
jgi:hypothetical protein